MSKQDLNSAEPIKSTLASMDEDLLGDLFEAAQFALNDVDTIERVSKELGAPVERLETMAGIFIALSVADEADHSTIDVVRTTQELESEAAKLAELKAEFEPN